MKRRVPPQSQLPRLLHRRLSSLCEAKPAIPHMNLTSMTRQGVRFPRTDRRDLDMAWKEES